MAKWRELKCDSRGTYRHIRTGGIYKILHEGLEVTNDEAVVSVVYSNENGDVFIQSKDRFFDGRFEKL